MSVRLAFVCDGCTSMLLEPVQSRCSGSVLRADLAELVPRGWILAFFPDGSSRVTCGGCQSADQRRLFLKIEDGAASLLPKGLVIKHG